MQRTTGSRWRATRSVFWWSRHAPCGRMSAPHHRWRDGPHARASLQRGAPSRTGDRRCGRASVSRSGRERMQRTTGSRWRATRSVFWWSRHASCGRMSAPHHRWRDGPHARASLQRGAPSRTGDRRCGRASVVCARSAVHVIPAKAGTQFACIGVARTWAPAFAGVTRSGEATDPHTVVPANAGTRCRCSVCAWHPSSLSSRVREDDSGRARAPETNAINPPAPRCPSSRHPATN